jgi:anion-transporting  ArsA/GET3 family ATPase
VFGNKAIGAFVEAVPGFHDLLQLGKIEHMVVAPSEDERYDLVVVDAPATGHGLTLLSTTSSMMDMTRVGPFYDLAAHIHTLLSDPLRTSLALVALPEELPVNESLELVAALGSERRQLRALVLNQVRRAPVGGNGAQPSWEAVRTSLLEADHTGLRALVRLGDRSVRRGEAQRRARARLQEGTRQLTGRRVPTALLPRVETPRLEPRHVLDLGATLHAQLEAPRERQPEDR